jgi:hypothetical protein
MMVSMSRCRVSQCQSDLVKVNDQRDKRVVGYKLNMGVCCPKLSPTVRRTTDTCSTPTQLVLD